jgi:hypothetical protein
MPNKLVELDIERADAVDRPAHRRTFILLKSEEPDELRANATELASRAVEALGLLAKTEANWNKEQIDALNALSEILELDTRFEATEVREATVKEEDRKEEEKVEEKEVTEEADREDTKKLAGNSGSGHDYERTQPNVINKDPEMQMFKKEDLDALAEVVAKAVATAMAPTMERLVEAVETKGGSVQKSAPASKQVSDGEETVQKNERRKFGEGMYTQTIFG